ncbi:MAG: hypothetical protein COA43_06670 [Robiginitomaculum sp.]|nr:MAG: hypothetical protein COA43_06670 [Robiginitomaculum sp.]
MNFSLVNFLIYIFYFFLGLATALVVFRLGTPLALGLIGPQSSQEYVDVITATGAFARVSFPALMVLSYPVYFISTKYVSAPSYVVLLVFIIILYLTRAVNFEGQIYLDGLKFLSLVGFFVIAIICPRYGLRPNSGTKTNF